MNKNATKNIRVIKIYRKLIFLIAFSLRQEISSSPSVFLVRNSGAREKFIVSSEPA